MSDQLKSDIAPLFAAILCVNQQLAPSTAPSSALRTVMRRWRALHRAQRRAGHRFLHGNGRAACDEVLYVFEGKGMLRFDGGSQPSDPMPASTFRRARFDILNSEPLTIVNSRCPDPGESAQMATGGAPLE